MKKIAFILLGPGHKDGSEITETVSARLALSEFNVKISYFSFDQEFDTGRNALVESQRITRGESLALENLNPSDFDALVLPGGSGMLKHLQNHPLFKEIILKFHQQSKPIGAICISPFLVGLILKQYRPLITLGESSDLILELKKVNVQHESCPSNDYITDRECKVLSTPAYMNDKATPFEVYTGIRLMLKELVEMA